jgi:uncharacterized protein (TIGR00255 family)
MTGFARRQTTWQGGSVSVEIRSVNHRFLDVACRLPRSLAHLEETFKKAIQERCGRGRIELSVSVQGGHGKAMTINLDQSLAKQYHRHLRTLKKTLKLSGSIDLALIAGLRDVLSISDQPPDQPGLARLIPQLLGEALEELVDMRAREGAALEEDLVARLTVIRDYMRRVAGRAPTLAGEALDRMKSRLAKLLEGVPDLPRLHQELAIFADRTDITEELVRLESHMVQFEQTLKHTEPIGKTLDFLLQEIGREVNTIGSKANDAEIGGQIVEMKAELERIREQTQNIE